MVKFTAAKCPSCGASLEVNEKLEKAMCQYCGDTILIKDAIAKIKVEHSGKVKVSSVKDSTDKLEIAKKYIKVGKENQALHVVSEILEENPFDLEALIISNDVYISMIEDNFNIITGKTAKKYEEIERESGKELREFFEKDDQENIDKIVGATRRFYDEIVRTNTTIKKIDDDKEHSDYLKKIDKKLKEINDVLVVKEKEIKDFETKKKFVFEKVKSYLDSTNNPKKRLKKLARKLGMKKFSGEMPRLGFKLARIEENMIVFSDGYSTSASFKSDTLISYDDMIPIIDEEIKNYKIRNIIIYVVSAIPSLFLLMSGHWILAIIAYCLIISALDETGVL